MNSLNSIYNSFYQLTTSTQKIQFLNDLKSQHLDYNINYDKLIEYYTNNPH